MIQLGFVEMINNILFGKGEVWLEPMGYQSPDLVITAVELREILQQQLEYWLKMKVEVLLTVIMSISANFSTYQCAMCKVCFSSDLGVN
jgi:hypothetical protein